MVVLIIGILSAVALPQYEVAVAKTRVTTLLPLVHGIDSAQQIFYLANGFYATRLDDLDLAMPSGGERVNDATVSYAGFLCYLRTGAGEDASVYCNDAKSGTRIEKYYISKNYICWTKPGNPSDEDVSVKVCRSISGLKTGALSGAGNGYSYGF